MYSLSYHLLYKISIHALRGEGDASSLGIFILTFVFLSTPSVGRATYRFLQTRPVVIISIHALRGEGDPGLSRLRVPDGVISIHALRGEGDPGQFPHRRASRYFYPRPPWGGRLKASAG